MSKALRKLAKPLFVLPKHPDSDSKSYATEVVIWNDSFMRVKYDSHRFTGANQKVFNLLKQNNTPGMMQKLLTHADWDQVEDDMDGIGLSILLQYYCHSKGAGEKQQMLNLVQASKDVFLCWKRFIPIGTYHETVLYILEVSTAAGARIGYIVASMNMVLEEQGTDPYGMYQLE